MAQTRTIPSKAPRGRRPELTVPFRERVSATIAEACQYSGLSERKIQSLIAERRVESFKVDKSRLINVPSFLRLLDSSTSAPLVEPSWLSQSRQSDNPPPAAGKEIAGGRLHRRAGKRRSSSVPDTRPPADAQ